MNNNHANHTINNNNNSNTTIQPNFFGNLFPNGSQASTNSSNNLIFNNPDLLSSSASLPIKNTLTYQTA